MIFYLKNLQIDPSSFAFVTHLCLEQVWTDSEEKGIKKGKIQKNTGVDAHMKENSIYYQKFNCSYETSYYLSKVTSGIITCRQNKYDKKGERKF